MTTLESAVQEHYGGDALAERVLAAAAQAGVTEITPVALSPADEFHTGGLGATRELAQLANLQPGQSVIDLGCGIGGPARILASEFGATVTGIDLTPAFVTAAETLTEQ